MLAADEIKHEFSVDNGIQCDTCLSVGRKLRPLGYFANIFKKITNDFDSQATHSIEKLNLCWECHALLKKVHKFQCRVQKVLEHLRFETNFRIYGPLSTLTTIVFNDKHPQVIYINETGKGNIEHELNDLDNDNISNDNVEDEQQKIEKESVIEKKKSNKWARKKAEQNRRKKFKVIANAGDFDQNFLKIAVNVDERLNNEGILSEQCGTCECVFYTENDLKAHNDKYHLMGKKIYVCDVCKKGFDTKILCTAHIKKHYEQSKYVCRYCDFFCFCKKKAARHNQVHKAVLQCRQCQLKFGYKEDLLNHYKEWHEKFICDKCGVSFKLRYCIKDHIRKQHSRFKCESCDKSFARYNGLWLHRRMRHSEHKDALKYLRRASNAPTKPVRVPCPDCDKVFTKKIYMKEHHNLVHLKLFKFRCEQCNKNFVRNADLVKHNRRIHEGIMPPRNKICSFCGRGFTTNRILSNHVRVHTGARPFPCASCPARFAQAAAKGQHERAAHGAKGGARGRKGGTGQHEGHGTT